MKVAARVVHQCQSAGVRPKVINELDILASLALQLQSLQILEQLGLTRLQIIASEKQSTYFDFENPVDLERLSQPMIALEPLRGLIVIDEIQQVSKSSERMPRAFHPPCDRRSRICGSIGYASFTQDRRVTPWRTK